MDFDDFIDNNNFFDGIKSNTPYFLAFFKGKNIASIENGENFIPIIINKMEEIHQSYINQLLNAFNQEQGKISTDSIGPTVTIGAINPVITNEGNQDKQQNIVTGQDEEHNEPNVSDNHDSHDEVDSHDEQDNNSDNSSASSRKSDNSNDSKRTTDTKNTRNTKSNKSEISNDTEKIRKEKEKLRKLKELQKLQNMLKN
jgi:hypothetical protein